MPVFFHSDICNHFFLTKLVKKYGAYVLTLKSDIFCLITKILHGRFALNVREKLVVTCTAYVAGNYVPIYIRGGPAGRQGEPSDRLPPGSTWVCRLELELPKVNYTQLVLLTSPKTGVELNGSGISVACKRFLCASSWSLCVSTLWEASLLRSLQPSG